MYSNCEAVATTSPGGGKDDSKLHLSVKPGTIDITLKQIADLNGEGNQLIGTGKDAVVDEARPSVVSFISHEYDKLKRNLIHGREVDDGLEAHRGRHHSLNSLGRRGRGV